jgi:mercuric ion transport protein
MKIELIYDADCPNVPAARSQLLRAFAKAGVEATWVEWDRSSRGSPSYARRYGSPTILIGGRDVVPEEMDAVANCCRLYFDNAGLVNRVPPIERIIAALQREASAPLAAAPSAIGRITRITIATAAAMALVGAAVWNVWV